MYDAFLSYSRKDKVIAEKLATTLHGAGFSIWWDQEVPIGRSFSRYIQEQLAQCKAVIVLWSKASTTSDWVCAEAEEGKERGILVPALVEPVSIPLGFRSLQTADLSAWDHHAESPELLRLINSVSLLARGVPYAPRISAPPPAIQLSNPPAANRGGGDPVPTPVVPRAFEGLETLLRNNDFSGADTETKTIIKRLASKSGSAHCWELRISAADLRTLNQLWCRYSKETILERMKGGFGRYGLGFVNFSRLEKRLIELSESVQIRQS
jgi:hypothetical protein